MRYIQIILPLIISQIQNKVKCKITWDLSCSVLSEMEAFM